MQTGYQGQLLPPERPGRRPLPPIWPDLASIRDRWAWGRFSGLNEAGLLILTRNYNGLFCILSKRENIAAEEPELHPTQLSLYLKVAVITRPAAAFALQAYLIRANFQAEFLLDCLIGQLTLRRVAVRRWPFSPEKEQRLRHISCHANINASAAWSKN